MEKVLVLWCLRALVGPARLADGRHLRYSNAARGFAILSLLFVPMVALAVTFLGDPPPMKDLKILLIVGAVLVAINITMAIEVFLVEHQYDDAGVDYRSPWSSKRRIGWANIAKIEWRPVLKWLDLVPADGSKRLHFSPMVGGLAPFAQLALQQIPPYAWAGQSEARVVLELLAAGQGAQLLVDSRTPSDVAAERELLACQQAKTEQSRLLP